MIRAGPVQTRCFERGLHESVEEWFGRRNLLAMGVRLSGSETATDIQRLWSIGPTALVPPLTLLLPLDVLGTEVSDFFSACREPAARVWASVEALAALPARMQRIRATSIALESRVKSTANQPGG